MNRPTIVEIRQYTLHPQQRDVLMDLFEKEFILPQESAGAVVLGQFVDLDDPDRFVWLRGFESMQSRERALTAFYGGTAWKAHRAAANATMLDSDNVLLLRMLDGNLAPAAQGGPSRGGVFTVFIHYIPPALMQLFQAFFETHLRKRLESWGVNVIATLQTELGANTFPQLPVRTGEDVFVWLSRQADNSEQEQLLARFRAMSGWREGAAEPLLPAFMRKPEVLRLNPSGHSKLR